MSQLASGDNPSNYDSETISLRKVVSLLNKVQTDSPTAIVTTKTSIVANTEFAPASPTRTVLGVFVVSGTLYLKPGATGGPSDFAYKLPENSYLELVGYTGQMSGAFDPAAASPSARVISFEAEV